MKRREFLRSEMVSAGPMVPGQRGVRRATRPSLQLVSFSCVLFLVLLAWRSQSASQGLAQEEAQNVMIIVADDLGVEALAVYGIGQNPANTPNLDALAAEGIVFEDAWAYPICTPYRAAVLTGRFGFRTGVGTVGGGGFGVLPAGEDLLPEILDAHPELGVSHAAIGKWHLGGGRNGPREHGFGYYAGALSVVEDYFEWQRSVNGRQAQETGYATSVQVNDASAWIADQNDDPWFVWMAFSAPHSPFHRPPEDLHSQDLPPGDPPEQGGDIRPYFLAAVEAMDHEIGRLLSEMDPAVRDRTTFIFMGDNGSPARAADDPFDRNTSKGSLFQGGIRTPLIIAGAGISEPGRRVTQMVHSVDLMATSLDLLGLTAADWPDNLDGQSLRPFMVSADPMVDREWAFSEQFGSQSRPANDGKAIRDKRYKYIRFDAGQERFYDLQEDPYEARDLLASGLSAIQQTSLDGLRKRLDTLINSPPVVVPPDVATSGPTPIPETSVPTTDPGASQTPVPTASTAIPTDTAVAATVIPTDTELAATATSTDAGLTPAYLPRLYRQ